MTFLRKKRTLKNMTLCGEKLPWVESAKNLGNTIVNNIDGMGQDIIEKRAQCITRNNELLQEFSFAHPTTKCLIYNVSNTHFSGSSLWNLYLIKTQGNTLECLAKTDILASQRDT